MRIGLGTAQLGLNYGITNDDKKVNSESLSKIINLARGSHIKYIDTAISYGDSEIKLGKNKIDDFYLISKLPKIPVEKENVGIWINDQVDESLKRLGVETLYALLLHDTSQLFDEFIGDEIDKALNKLKEQGKIKKFGVSAYDPKELQNILKKFSPEIVQLPMNVFDNRFQDHDCLKIMKDKNIEIHSRSAFLQGLLLLNKENLPNQFKKWKSLFEKWQKWLEFNNISAVEACLGHCLSFKEVDCVVVGVDSFMHFNEVIELANRKAKVNYPLDFSSKDIDLINPLNWEI